MKKQRPEHYTSEEKFAAILTAWLEANQWDVYQEVQIDTYGKVADIVARRGSIRRVRR